MSEKTNQKETVSTTVVEATHSVYESLCDRINIKPVRAARPLEAFQDNDLLAESPADERMARAVGVFLQMVGQASRQVDRLDKTLLDFPIGQLDQQIGAQLDAVMHSPAFQRVESAWRGLKFLVDRTDFRKNVRIDVLDVSKEALQQDFDDAPEISQSGLYRHAYVQEYDTPGGEPIGAVISNYEFDQSTQDIALLRNVSKVAASAHMPFIGSVGPAFFGKQTLKEVASGNCRMPGAT